MPHGPDLNHIHPNPAVPGVCIGDGAIIGANSLVGKRIRTIVQGETAMKNETLQSKHGYAIPCHNTYNGEDKLLIVCHGFGSSKSSPMVRALERLMPLLGIGVYSFDFPAHGDSPVWDLRVPYCIDDLETVEEHVRAIAPKVRIGYFASSFGAYITLLYLSRGVHWGDRAFLRSAAVAMPRLVDTWVGDKARAQMAKQGYFVPDYDYVREMRVTPAFLQDLADYDVFKRYRKDTVNLFMVHGGRDSVAPPEAAREFAQKFGATLLELPYGEHDLMGQMELPQVLAAAAGFFLAPREYECT